LFPLAARYLGPVDFGAWSLATAFVGLFRILPDFGMSYASTLAISRERSEARRLTGNLLGFQAVLSLLTLGLCLGIGRLLYHGVFWIAVVVLSFDLILKALKVTLRWLLKSFEMFGTEAASLLIERLLILALGFWSLRAGWGVVGFVVVFVLVRLPDTAGLYAYIHGRVVPLVPSYDKGLWRELFQKGLPFAYAGAMILLFFQVDTVLLGQILGPTRGPTEVGWYSAPVRILEGLSLVPRILSYALIPTMASLYKSSPSAVSELYRRGSKYLLLAGLPVAAFGILESHRFIPLIFGEKFLPSVSASRILIPAAAFMFLSNFGETTLACINRWGTIVIVSTLALVVNVALNLLWIPIYGYHGAAWATLLTEAAYFAMTALALWKYGQRASWLALVARPALATPAFALALWLARDLPFLWASVLASAAFLPATLLLGVFDQKEIDLIKGLLRGGAPLPPEL